MAFSSHSSSPSVIRKIEKDWEVDSALENEGLDKCLILYFFLPWCGACTKMNLSVENIAHKNTAATFIKVDAEKCVKSSRKNRVTRVPLFILYSNGTRVDRVEGASPLELETKIKRIQMALEYKKNQNQNKAAPSPSSGSVPPTLQEPLSPSFDLSRYLDKRKCMVVNDLLPTTFQQFMEGQKLISGQGVGKVLLIYAFKEPMVIQSFKIKAPIPNGPRVLRFFTDVGANTDIEMVNRTTAKLEVILFPEDLSGDHQIDLRQGGFVGVSGLQILVQENMGKTKKTEISQLLLNGVPFITNKDPHNTNTHTNIDQSIKHNK